MVYKALYRKYRPNNFDGVYGQTVIVKTLKNIVKDQKIAHAYLFNGPRGTGKTSIAKIFAKSINCLNPNNGQPCDECLICKSFNEETCSDIIEIDGASNNKVEHIRELKSKIDLSPSLCKYKVYIIDEVHMLTSEAFNAFLKTLEEPPGHVVFILATTEMHKLPLTIISRCQNYNFKKVTEEQMKTRLKFIASQENISISDEALDQIVTVSDGGMRDSIGLLEQLISFSDNNITIDDVNMVSSSVSRKEISTIFEHILNNNVIKLFELIDIFYQSGKDFSKITESMVLFLKDILIFKKANKYFNRISLFDIESYLNNNPDLKTELIFKYINVLTKMTNELKNVNHSKVIFEINMLKLIDIENIEESNNIELIESKIENTTNEIIDNAINNDIKEEKIEINNANVIKEKNIEKNIDNVIKEENIETNIDNVIKEDIEESNSTEKDISKEVNKDFLPEVKIELYKKILINNTLAEADKEILKDIKNIKSQLKTLLINKDLKNAASILLDGTIVGASSKMAIYTYQYDVMVDKADDNLKDIKNLIKELTKIDLEIINITNKEWLEIRPYYVKIVKEQGHIDKIAEISKDSSNKKIKGKKKSKEIEDAISIFGEDLIEIK